MCSVNPEKGKNGKKIQHCFAKKKKRQLVGYHVSKIPGNYSQPAAVIPFRFGPHHRDYRTLKR